MKAIVEPRFGCIRYKTGVFEDIDEYFEKLVVGDITPKTRIPFRCDDHRGDVLVNESRLYFSVVVDKLEDIVRHRKNILNGELKNNSVLIYPSFIVKPLKDVEPGFYVFESLSGYIYVRVYDKKTKRRILLQRVHWASIEGIDGEILEQYMSVYLHTLMENTVRYLRSIVGEYNIEGNVNFID